MGDNCKWETKSIDNETFGNCPVEYPTEWTTTLSRRQPPNQRPHPHTHPDTEDYSKTFGICLI